MTKTATKPTINVGDFFTDQGHEYKIIGWHEYRGEKYVVTTMTDTKRVDTWRRSTVERLMPQHGQLRCPNCDSWDIGTCEIIQATATVLSYDLDTGEFEYGETKVHWDTSTAEEDPGGNFLMWCLGCNTNFSVRWDEQRKVMETIDLHPKD